MDARTTRRLEESQPWPVAFAAGSQAATRPGKALPARTACLSAMERAEPAQSSNPAQPGWWSHLAPPQPQQQGRARFPSHQLVGSRYEVLGLLGKGGMGHVLRVFDRDLRRYVAMKILRPGPTPSSSEMLARFVEEAQVSSQLEHPNIMPVYDLGLLESGEPFYTMQLVTGRSLAEVLEQPRRTRDGLASPVGLLAEGLDILGKTLSAVAYAHDKGVVHRDLKPENIMIGRFDEVLVMDWGLSKILQRPSRVLAAQEAESRKDQPQVESVRSLGGCHTRDGALAGTLLYMAPEQAYGMSGHISERTDVWGLGAILYTLLAGRAPHVWGEAVHCNEALLRHAREEPVQPIGRGPRGQRVPLALERIALKALERDPDLRYANAGEMLEALKGVARSVGRRRFVVRGWAGNDAHEPRPWQSIAAVLALTAAGIAAAAFI